MTDQLAAADWRNSLPGWIRPYFETGPVGCLLLGMASGFPIAMIAATLTTRLAESGIEKKTVTAFALALLMYNLKLLWAPVIDRWRLPVLARLVGHRRAWLLVTALGVMAAVSWLGVADPVVDIGMVVAAAVAVGFAGASFDIVIDAYRIENLTPEQLGTGSGMTQYGWRLGNALAASTVLVLAGRVGWSAAYVTATLFVLPALAAALLLGEPARQPIVGAAKRGWAAVKDAVVAPLGDFLRRQGAGLTLLFILFHKIGDTVANLSLRLLFADLGFSKDEIAGYDVGIGFVALLVGIFVGGLLYKAMGMKAAVLASLVLMAVSNLGFAVLAMAGHSNAVMATVIAFENFSSGFGGVAVGAYFAALCDHRFTATQFALVSAAASVVGRTFSASTAGGLIEAMGYVDFYLLTTVLALPGILIFLYMMRAGLVDDALPPALRPA
ncbi:AmpG family muropeptide MFS transporter [Sandarakinorhabdus sp. DWP1-3-1]|uniref:AmpG family muropeptide MFS transporter n=1 Tax=Sandarakinorhabdus sp. DWP1-3-1 TaxID=2804627 RepID=UPI003CE8E4E6